MALNSSAKSKLISPERELTVSLQKTINFVLSDNGSVVISIFHHTLFIIILKVNDTVYKNRNNSEGK